MAGAATADQLIARFGAEGGFSAIVWGLERGYSASQLVAAVDADALDPGGVIDGDAGLGAPAYGIQGVVTLPESEDGEAAAPSGGVRVVLNKLGADDDLLSPVAFFSQLQDLRGESRLSEEAAGRHFLAMVVALAQTGYSLDQIVGLLLADDALVMTVSGGFNTEDSCAVVVGTTTSGVILPELLDESGGCGREFSERFVERRRDDDSPIATEPEASSACPLPSDLDLPATLTFVAADMNFDPAGAPAYDTYDGTLTLNADGSFSVSWFADRYEDITIRDAPNQQYYQATAELTGVWEVHDEAAGVSGLNGTGEGSYRALYRAWDEDPAPTDQTVPVITQIAYDPERGRIQGAIGRPDGGSIAGFLPYFVAEAPCSN